jgi:hypothetical protein
MIDILKPYFENKAA